MRYLFILLLFSCAAEEKYPRYEIQVVEVVPDSLKTKQQNFITETIRAANQRLTAGDYEEVYETVYAVRNVSTELYSVQVVALKKRISGAYGNYIYILPENMTEEEKRIFQELQ